MTRSRTITALSMGAALLLGACSPAGPTPAGPRATSLGPGPGASAGVPLGTARAGNVAGRVTYADGRALPGAHVVTIGVEYTTELDLETDADGLYAGSIEQTDANYWQAGWIEVPFEGESYLFPLEPVGAPDTHFHGSNGSAKDFVWRLTGRGSWAGELQADDRRAMIGGIIGVFVYDPLTDPSGANALALPVGTIIEVSLRPMSSLVDGTTAQPITATIILEEATGPYEGEVGSLNDVPLARYEATARVSEPGGSPRDLVLGATCTRSGCPLFPASLSETAEILFPPADPQVHSKPFQRQPVAGLALYLTMR